MTKYICPQCGNNRWKTRMKGESWECRNCGHIKGEVISDWFKSDEPVVSHAQERTPTEKPREVIIPKLRVRIPKTITNMPIKKLKWWKRALKRFKK